MINDHIVDRLIRVGWSTPTQSEFYAGHGESSGPKFGVSNHDSGKVKHSELRLGNSDLEWAIFDACYVCKERGKYYDHCYDIFKGLHYIFGFHTVVGDNPHRGGIFVDYLNAGESFRNAWIRASQDTEPFTTSSPRSVPRVPRMTCRVIVLVVIAVQGCRQGARGQG